MQVLTDQQVLKTKRTRDLVLSMLPEGEDAAAWERKLLTVMKTGNAQMDVNPAMWTELSDQVQTRTYGQLVRSAHVGTATHSEHC